MEQTPREERNRKFLAHKARHPETTYAEWLHQAAVSFVSRGGRHATLGGDLGHDDWWDAGRSYAERLVAWFAVKPASRVVDYGCGSLRIGGHFIRHLQPGGYFGLDVTLALIETGEALVGPDLLAEKRPQFGSLDEGSLQRATAFAADFVMSTAVCYHVHPDEAPTYFGNLLRLTHKPGATLFFDVSVSDQPMREHALSMPIDYYIEALAPLEFVKLHVVADRRAEKQIIGVAEFRRSGATA